MNPLIVNVRHAKGGFVYVGRVMHARGLAESPYANPFPITKTETRRKVLLDYIEHFIAQVSANNTDFRPEVLSRLAGKRLGCWCAPEPCHAELVSIAAELANEVLRETCAPTRWTTHLTQRTNHRVNNPATCIIRLTLPNLKDYIVRYYPILLTIPVVAACGPSYEPGATYQADRKA